MQFAAWRFRLFIQRVQVEEGFLDGLDLEFCSGLNVIIGARGTGKTSLIELVRFGLGVRGHTLESAKRAREHALSVLGDGQVIVTLLANDQTVVVTRSAHDDAPRMSSSYAAPMIFSQTEIEAVGLSQTGRVRLVDSFVKSRGRLLQSETAAVGEIKSLSAEILNYRAQVSDLQDKLRALPEIEAKLSAIAPKEKALSESSVATAEKKKQLDSLTKQLSDLAVSDSYLARLSEVIARWQQRVSAILQEPLEAEQLSGEKRAADAANHFSKAKKHLTAASRELTSATNALRESHSSMSGERVGLENQARQLRREIDSIQAGAGAIVREAAALRQSKAQLQALQGALKTANAKLKEKLKSRGEALDRLDSAREKKFEQRRQVVQSLNTSLGPRISIEIERAGNVQEYASAISDVIRGSGLRYTDLAPIIAENISPRELVEAVESNDPEVIIQAGGVTRDRAMRLLSQFRESNLGDLATVTVEDDVCLKLLDGAEYKDLSELSTGQRCTVILPIVLEHKDRIVIVDQPEDHIDNAFIADTVVKAVRQRSDETQMIFSTHNANIPVLGGADCVVQMGSDGRRGFAMVRGPLDDKAVVQAITGVMEGGKDAFRQRAEFYAKHRN